MPLSLDLFVLTADADQKAAIDALLEHRTDSLGIRRCQFQVRKHPQRDPGCVGNGIDLLGTVRTQARHAILIFDREGSGRDETAAVDLERELDAKLEQAGWQDRARAVVIDPEAEIWLWSESPHVAKTFGWRSEMGDLRAWLAKHDFATTSGGKPVRPKEAMLAVLRETGVKRSAANFAAIARYASLERCQDRSFLRLRDILRGWFPAT